MVSTTMRIDIITHLPPFSILVTFICFATYCNIRNRRYLRTAKSLGCRQAPSHRRRWWDLYHVRSLVDLLRHARHGQLYDWFVVRFASLSKQTGFLLRTYAVDRLGAITIVTIDPDNIKTILSHRRNDYSLQKRIKWFGPFIGSKSFFTKDGPAAAHDRALIRPALAREHVGNLTTLERHVNVLLSALTVNSSTWTDFLDIQPLFCRLTMDNSTEYFWGQSVDSQSARLANITPQHSKDDFTTSYDITQDFLSKRVLLDNIYFTKDSFRFRQACRAVQNVVQPHIHRIVNSVELKSERQETTSGSSRYILLEEIARQSSDAAHLQDTSMALLLAGRDTTAALLSWLFYHLARHPDVFKELRSSIIKTFGTTNDPKDITFENLKGCKLLQWAISETLRTQPPVPINSLNACRDTTLPRGGGPDGTAPVFVPKGARVSYCIYALQRDQEFWGPDADDWRPHRWDGRKQGWDYLPFNAGPRVCLGQQFALTTAAYTAVRLLQRFDALETCDTDRVPRMTTALVSFSQTGTWIRLKKSD